MYGHVRNYVLVWCVVCATGIILNLLDLIASVWLNLLSIYRVMLVDGWCNIISHFICMLILSYASRLYSHTKAHICNVLGGVRLNMCIGIWGHFEIFMHIFRGSSSISWLEFLYFIPPFFSLNWYCQQSPKRGEIESASRPLINFGDFWQSQFRDMMLSRKCMQE